MWRDLADATGSRLRLAPSLLSGMSFRWKQRADCVFEGVLGSDAYELREAADGVQWRVVSAFPAGDAELRLRAHLSLDRGVDVDAWLPQLHEPPACFVTACTHLGGVRVLSVAQLEAVVTFMGSANNNIKRNMQMVEALCAHFGTNAIETVPGTASAHFRFPSVAQLCELSEAQLWELGWGYRAPRLHKLARQLAERGGENFLLSLSTLPEPAARAALCELCGIGRKVADCVLLFAYGHDGCVPVDTHCLQLAQTRLLPAVRGLSLTPAVYDRIVARFHELFGAQHAGWAFMVMFVGELSDFKKRVQAAIVAERMSLQDEAAARLLETPSAPSPVRRCESDAYLADQRELTTVGEPIICPPAATSASVPATVATSASVPATRERLRPRAKRKLLAESHEFD